MKRTGWLVLAVIAAIAAIVVLYLITGGVGPTPFGQAGPAQIV